MKEKITKLNLKLPEPEKTELILGKLFPGYNIKYKKFPDIWEIKNNQFKHSIWYYSDKESLLKTTLSKEYKETIILNIVLIILTIVIVILNEKYSWMKNYFALIIWLIIISVSNYLVWAIKPKYKKDFLGEHDMAVQKISEFKIT